MAKRKKWTPKTTREPEGLRVVRAFVDTRLAEEDPFDGPSAFVAWLRHRRLVDDDTAVTADDAANARQVREGFAALLAKSSGAEVDKDAVGRLNAALGEVSYRVRFGLATGRREPVAKGWPLVRARLAEAVLTTMDEKRWRRLKVCTGCGRAFYDTSSNGSRKWCSAPCSSRTTSRNFRRRHPSQGGRYVAEPTPPDEQEMREQQEILAEIQSYGFGEP